MASRRSHATSHSRSSISAVLYVTLSRRVPMGHVSIRNPLQAPKERSCGISITSLSLGSAKRDQQLILNLLAFVGAWLWRDAIASWVCYAKLMYNLTVKQEFISESRLGRALTKTFLHIPFVSTPFGFMISFGEWALRERCSRHPSSKRYHEWCWSITVPTKRKNIKKTQGSWRHSPSELGILSFELGIVR